MDTNNYNKQNKNIKLELLQTITKIAPAWSFARPWAMPFRFLDTWKHLNNKNKNKKQYFQYQLKKESKVQSMPPFTALTILHDTHQCYFLGCIICVLQSYICFLKVPSFFFPSFLLLFLLLGSFVETKLSALVLITKKELTVSRQQ